MAARAVSPARPAAARAAVASPAAKSALREWVDTALIAVTLALFVRTFVFQTFKIPSGSMETTLLVGDQLIVDKMIFGAEPAIGGSALPTREIRRGEVLVFKYPVDPERDFIKRVVGLPGETIELRNKKVFVDGKPIEEPYATFLFPPEPEGSDSRARDPRWYFGPFKVPPDHYFMMGDNRDNSEDSRFWGAMPRNHVKGKALFIHFSLADQGWRRIFRQIR